MSSEIEILTVWTFECQNLPLYLEHDVRALKSNYFCTICVIIIWAEAELFENFITTFDANFLKGFVGRNLEIFYSGRKKVMSFHDMTVDLCTYYHNPKNSSLTQDALYSYPHHAQALQCTSMPAQAISAHCAPNK